MILQKNLNSVQIKEFTASKQATFFDFLKQSQYSGQLSVHQSEQRQWTLYIYLGRIIYATGGVHPVRRYKRNLSIFMPALMSELAQYERKPELLDSFSSALCWEYELLKMWSQQGKLDRKQLNNFIVAQINEILFDLTQAKQVTIEYVAQQLVNPLILIDPEKVVAEAWRHWQNWQNSKLADRYPDTAPVVIHPEELRLHANPKTYQGMTKLLDGKRSLRDLVVVLKQDLAQFTSMLSPYIQMGLIELIDIPDLKAPFKAKADSNILIACVDDSPMICQTMEKIITGAGYNFLGINDDLRAISILLNHKPDMIFLDLIMPHLNGYEICSKLRKVSTFAHTPIIVLSSYINVIDRFKGKRSRCSDFLSKPIHPKLVFNSISRHLPSKVG